MAMTKKITLYDEKKPLGSKATPDIVNRKTIWCEEEEVSVKNTFAAMSANITISKQVVVWKKEYEGQAYATMQGRKYKIISVHTSHNSAFKLLLFLERRN